MLIEYLDLYFKPGDLIKFNDGMGYVIHVRTNNIVRVKENEIAIICYFSKKLLYFYVKSLQSLCYCHVTRVLKYD